MKKLVCLIMSLCLLVSLAAMNASASTLEEAELKNFVQDYLSASASAKYNFTDADLTVGTVSELSAAKLKPLQSLQQAEKLSASSSTSDFTIDATVGEYLSQKAEYIKYTRMQEGLNISNFSVTYGEPQVVVDGNCANVKIFETVGMRYEGLDEDSAISTCYDINLIKSDDGWKIADIQSDDLFDATHSRDKFDCEEAIAEYTVQQAEPARIIQEVAAPDMEVLEAQAAASGAKVYPYNHSAAAFYSNQYTTSTGANTRSYYNPNFSNYAGSGGDCMNFASQCMFAGFGGSDDSPINTTAIPMDRQGAGYYDYWYKDAGTWTGTLSFQGYCDKVNHNLGSPIPKENNMYVDTYETGPNSAGIYDYANRLPGSVVFIYDGSDNYGHAMVVGKVTGSASSQIFVSAHTNDVKLQPLSQCCGGRTFKIVVPSSFYAYTNKPALRVTSSWKNNVPSGTSVTFSATAQRLSGGTCYRMSMKVVSPSGKTTWLGEKTNTNSYSATTTLTEKGLYKITAYARETASSPSNVGNTIALRTY